MRDPGTAASPQLRSAAVNITLRHRRLPPLRSAISQAVAVQGRKVAAAAKSGNLVPLHRCIFSDHLTPMLAYHCLVKEDDREAPSFLFESVEQGYPRTNVSRYSLMGAQPALEILAKDNLVTIMDHEEGVRTEEIVEDPMQIPRRMMEGWSPQLIDELHDVLCGEPWKTRA